MDFEPRYTAEQQAFRQEVSGWLDGNLPDGLEFPADSDDLSYGGYLKLREVGRRLGAKGWLWPTAPTEYGGGGLSIDRAIVIEEELDARGLSLPPYYDSGGRLGGASVLVRATTTRKSAFCRPSSGAKSARGSCSPSRARGRTSPASR